MPDSTKRNATCMCGNLSIVVNADPQEVYICRCTECQRLSGGAFSCRGVFEEHVSVSGEGRTW